MSDKKPTAGATRASEFIIEGMSEILAIQRFSPDQKERIVRSTARVIDREMGQPDLLEAAKLVIVGLKYLDETGETERLVGVGRLLEEAVDRAEGKL